MAKIKKQPRPKAITPKGFRDYFGAEVSARKVMLDQIAEVYHRYGFDASSFPMWIAPMPACLHGKKKTMAGSRCAMI
jgi:histidyl-tRNA synthetase